MCKLRQWSCLNYDWQTTYKLYSTYWNIGVDNQANYLLYQMIIFDNKNNFYKVNINIYILLNRFLKVPLKVVAFFSHLAYSIFLILWCQTPYGDFDIFSWWPTSTRLGCVFRPKTLYGEIHGHLRGSNRARLVFSSRCYPLHHTHCWKMMILDKFHIIFISGNLVIIFL